MIRAECIYMPNCVLAEGCVWIRNEHALYFTDIEGQAIYCLSIPDGSAVITRTDGMTGCLVPHKDGGIVAAQSSGLVHWARGRQYEMYRQKLPSYLRYNDGKCDCHGNLWVGTMAVSQTHPMAQNGGSLYCIGDGKIKAEYPGYTIPNGLAWSRDNQIFYHIDTVRGCVDAYDIENQVRLKNRRTAVRVSPKEGSPDGMCMDENGNLWIAIWGGGRVNCYDSASGEKLEEIQVPDKFVTCCCFGGKDGKQLFITTARDALGNGGQIYCAGMTIGGADVYAYGGEQDET